MPPSLRQKALNFLSRREHSRQELARKLERDASVSESEIQTLLDTLEKQKLLSDFRFAESYCQSRFKKGFGFVRIEQELAERGVSDDIIVRLTESIPREERVTLCQQVRQKKFGSALPKTLQEKAKQTQFLSYRGFSFEEIKEIFEKR